MSLVPFLNVNGPTLLVETEKLVSCDLSLTDMREWQSR
jgi:hypothetical protein